ncbi:MAG: hypothetical protein JST00_08110 [Deltaproteobacteria bacterium]|nr:hypothetical protein [Deltaproteobacteria bacterium]
MRYLTKLAPRSRALLLGLAAVAALGMFAWHFSAEELHVAARLPAF